MIESLRHGAVVVLECDHKARFELHGRAELDRCPARIRNVQGASLVRDLRPLRRQPGFLEEHLGLLQILLGEDAQTDSLGLRLAPRAFEDEAVVARLGNAAQIDRVAILVAHDEPEQIDIEVATDRQIPDGENIVARARDVERRIVDGFGDAHGALHIVQ